MLTCKREYINTSLQLRTSRINGSRQAKSAQVPNALTSCSSPVWVSVRTPFDWGWLKLCTAQSHIKFNIQSGPQRGVAGPGRAEPPALHRVDSSDHKTSRLHLQREPAQPSPVQPSSAAAVKGLALTASQTANIVDTGFYRYVWGIA